MHFNLLRNMFLWYTKYMKASIIIRTKNEQKWLGSVLRMLETQTEKDFEVVIVDSGSMDNTLKIANEFSRKLDLKIHNIPANKFTYPYACNYGSSRASGKYLVFISGHSVPISNKWLESGLSDFTDKGIAGVYGSVKALSDASVWEKIFYGLDCKSSKKKIIKARIGVLGNTNAIIRKDLWLKHQFDEKYKSGGEDTAWARYFLNQGFSIIRDPEFTVRHSHQLGLFALIQQIRHWHYVASKF